jgi:hypothetical protein
MPNEERGRTFMGAKGEVFAKQFEAKAEEATALLEKLSETDWKKTTAAERWTVAVTAHHIASSYESATHIVKAITAGLALPHFNREMLDEMNAQHAEEFAGCTKAETIALHRKTGAAAAAAVRSLSDEELAKTDTVFAGMPPVSAEELVKHILLGHIDAHFGSIRATIGG